MTQMGLNYLNYKETLRSNQANEGIKTAQNQETNRHNLVSENVSLGELTVQRGSLDEKVRSNKANEALTASRNEETKRSNLANESLTATRNAETQRSNLANELLTSERNAETERANMATDATNRYRANLSNASDLVSSQYAGEGLGADTTVIAAGNVGGILSSLLPKVSLGAKG